MSYIYIYVTFLLGIVILYLLLGIVKTHCHVPTHWLHLAVISVNVIELIDRSYTVNVIETILQSHRFEIECIILLLVLVLLILGMCPWIINEWNRQELVVLIYHHVAYIVWFNYHWTVSGTGIICHWLISELNRHVSLISHSVSWVSVPLNASIIDLSLTL